MLLVWRGLGYLVPLLTLLSMVAMEALMRATTGNRHFYQAHGWPKLLGLWIGATVVWLFGRSLVKKGDAHNHAFMRVPVHYWAPVLALAGVAAAFVVEKPPVFTVTQITEQQAQLGDSCGSDCTQADGTADQCHAKCACVVTKLATQYPTRESWSQFVELEFTDHDEHARQIAAARTQCGFR
jgi:hypothetical protein